MKTSSRLAESSFFLICMVVVKNSMLNKCRFIVRRGTAMSAVYSLIILCLAFLVFLPALSGDILLWDDADLITHNYRVKYFSWATAIDILRPVPQFGMPAFALYVPLTELTIAAEYALVGEYPALYHLDNVLLHVLNTLLVIVFIWCLTGRRTTALLTGLFFAIHPLHVESVAWISERKDVLCTFFYLSTLIMMERWQRKQHWRWFAGAQLCGIMALLAKPLAVTLPAALMLCDVYKQRAGRWQIWTQKTPLILAAIYCTLATIYQQHAHGAFTTRDAGKVFVNILIACHGILLYVVKMLMPVRLSPIYPRPEVIYLTSPVTVTAILLTLSLVLLGVAAWRRWPNLAFALAFFLLTIAPNSQLLPAGLNIYAADRFFYLPGIALLYLLALGVTQLLRLPHVRYAIIGVLVALCLWWSCRTWTYTQVWQSDFTLWRYLLTLLPEWEIAKNNLAIAHQIRGDRTTAIDLYRDLLSNKTEKIALANLAMEYYKTGDITQSLYYANLSLQHTSNDFYQGLFVRAAAHVALRDYSNALTDIGRVVELEPLFAEARLRLADTLLNAGSTNASVGMFWSYLRLEKKDARALARLAILLETTGDILGARDAYSRLARCTDNHSTWYRVGWLSLRVRDFTAARTALERAVQLRPKSAQAWSDLAVVHREVGQTNRALEFSAYAQMLNPQSSKVLYDRACILATSQHDEEALLVLSNAICIAPQLRVSAQADPDLARLRMSPAFLKLMQQATSIDP